MSECIIIEFEDALINMPSILIFHNKTNAEIFLKTRFEKVEFSNGDGFVNCISNGIEYYADVKNGKLIN